ncbi:helix-turn-helix domain-containing protein [Geodermatophilus sp. SYSU D00867]
MEQYAAGRSLRELAELTDRSFSAVRKILDRHGVRRRGPAHHRDTDPAGPVDGPRLAGVDGPSASGLPDPTVHEV